MNAKFAVTITATGDTRKQLSGSDGGFVFNPYYRSPYAVTVEASSFSRMLSNVIVVGGRPGSRGCAGCFVAGVAVITYVEAEGIDASAARVAASDIERRRDRAMGPCSRKPIPRRGKRYFMSTNRTCWNKA
jgi:hypothetical protein